MINKFTKYFLFSLSLLTACCNISFAQLSWNQAGKFNGSTQPYTYLAIPSASEFNDVDECMYELWVYMLSYPNVTYYQFFNKDLDYQIAYDWFSGVYARNINSSGTDLDGPTLSLNRWYHLAVVIRDTNVVGFSNSKVRELYIDGALNVKDVQQYTGGTLGNGTDSVKVGSYGGPNFLGTFNGYIDDVRMWLGKFYPDDVGRNFRTPLNAWGNSNNPYYKCILSITFQDSDNSGAPFVVSDGSRYNHTITNRSVTGQSLSSRPSVTTSDNLAVHFNGSTDYIAGPDHLNNSPDTQLTMEAWVYPERIYNGGFSDFGTIIFKGFAATNYRMFLGANNSLYVTINGNGSFGYAGTISAPPNQWTHIAFTYAASTGNYAYYINGALAGSGVNSVGNIVNGTDSLYIGQSNGGNFFQGYIDEVRIAAYTKSQSQINDFVYKSMDLGNRPSAFELSSYNFDGYLTNNNGVFPRLYFRNGAVFSSRYISSNKNFPISPMLKADNFSFPAAWYMKNNSIRIPQSGTSGSSQYDTINIPYCMGILDVNVFLALNHTYEEDLSVYLISPAGDSVEMIKGNTSMKRGQYITIFNDQADSSIVSDRFASFLPNIKPSTSLSSALSQENTWGNWKLRVNDGVNGDTGMVYAWGLQFNNMIAKPNLMTLTATGNQSGFWTGSSQPTDTIRMYLRQSIAPYTKVDSAIGYVNQFGFCTTYLANAASNSYYIEYKHRNSLAVWSNIPKSFTQGGSTSFSFLAGPGNVYGGDLLFTGGRWCMYTGDINQDGAINGNDFTIFNQQFGQSGYIASDLNGDNTVNGNDFTVFNTGFGHQTNHP